MWPLSLTMASLPHDRWIERKGREILIAHKRRSRHMSSLQNNHSTFLSIAPRFVVLDLEQALAFYGQLGFQTTYRDEHFAVLKRDGVDLHLNAYSDAPVGNRSVCWIAVTNSMCRP